MNQSQKTLPASVMALFCVLASFGFSNARNIHKYSYSYVCRVDVAIGHSLGSFSVTALAGNSSLFGSLALILPFPGHQPVK